MVACQEPSDLVAGWLRGADLVDGNDCDTISQLTLSQESLCSSFAVHNDLEEFAARSNLQSGGVLDIRNLHKLCHDALHSPSVESGFWVSESEVQTCASQQNNQHTQQSNRGM